MHTRAMVRLLGVASVVAALCLLAGCAGRRAYSTGTQGAGTVLEYRVPEGAAMTYVFTNYMSQSMEVQGQSVPIESTQAMTFTIVGVGESEDGSSLSVTVDDLSVTIESPQGNVEADVAGVLGRSFDMMLSRRGEESGLPEPESLQFTIEPEGTRSVIPGFEIMFPDVTGEPVRVGSEWPTSVNVTEPTGNGEATIALDTTNTVEGFEKVGDHECVRIASVFRGTIGGSGTQQGMPWSLASDVTGSGVWFFDVENGVYVKDTNEGVAVGAITVETPNGEMEFPMSRDFTITTELVE